MILKVTSVIRFKIILYFVIVLFFNCSNEEITNYPPGDFNIDVINIHHNEAELVWTKSEDPEESEVFYDIYLNEKKQIDNTQQLSFNLEDLKEDTSYSGKIIASDPEGNTTEKTFTFNSSKIPAPSNFTVNVVSSYPYDSEIRWSESKDSNNSKIVYNIYLNDELVKDKIEDLDFRFSELKGLSKYLGKIEAINEFGKINTQVFSFTTSVKIYEGTLHLQYQHEVEEFVKKGFNVVEDNLILGSVNAKTDVSDFSGLHTLRSVNGSEIIIQNTLTKNLKGLKNIVNNHSFTNLYIQENDELINLEGAPFITKLHNLFINANDKLSNIDGLNNLSEVDFNVSISSSSLQSLYGLRNLESVRNLSITHTQITNFNGLQKITNLQNITITHNGNITNFDGFNNLKTVSGSMIISENINLKTLHKLYNINSIHSISITLNEKLISLDGLDNLEKNQNISLNGNINLTDLKGLRNIKESVLTNLNRELVIWNCESLQTLDGLENFDFKNGRISINNNNSLIDFCALSNLINNSNSIEYYIRNNYFNPSKNDFSVGNCKK
jgi:hypothetical protein